MQGANFNLNLNNQKDLYSKFANGKNVSNKEFLAHAYGKDFYTSNHEIQYYNTDSDIKSKKRNKKVQAILLSTAFCATAALGYALGRNKHSINFEEIGKKANQIADEVKKLNFKNKITNALTNSTNIKDDAWDVFANYLDEKTPLKFIKKWGDNLTGFYKKNVKKSTSKYYQNIIDKIKKTQGGENFAFDDFEKLFNNIDESISGAVKKNRISKNLLSGKDSKFKNLINNVTSDNLANKEIIKNGILDKVKLLTPPEDANEELKELIEKHNKLFSDILIPKLRDINCGSAPTDIITMGLPIIGLGVGIANADDKADRKSILLDVGFPLIGTVTMPIAGTYFPALNGIKLIIAGFASGQILSGCAKMIDSITTKINKKADELFK